MELSTDFQIFRAVIVSGIKKLINDFDENSISLHNYVHAFNNGYTVFNFYDTYIYLPF